MSLFIVTKRGVIVKQPKQRYSRVKSKLKRMTISILTIFILLVSVHYLSTANLNPVIKPAIAETKQDIPKSNSIKTNLSTQDLSYVLINPETNQILKSHNPDTQRAPASTLKLITGLIAIDVLKTTDIIKVGTEVNVEGSRLGLRPGDQISVQNLLTALYVNSSNDAAAALAVKISGSIPAFAQRMNEYAATLGCQNTHFTTPHGMPEPGQYTTANDLSKIALQFIENEELMGFVQEVSAHVQWTDAEGILHNAYLQNTNRLLEVYPGDKGLKTGTTTEAGQCLVTYVSRPDGDLLLVLLGSKQRYEDTILLLDETWAEQRPKAALKGLAKDPRSLILSPGLF
ncbi:MAG: D-alanyl-D-alanine carboxypeptidase [Desulfosporosinus sp.]|nr:D-alanyl-D-alanine carboxypeptidase [Desulfosporosinus sp.]MBC2725323.1 D-alanyl-D-alanine carboxypeptidase [Desulfosporosinus sp.]